MLEHKGKSLGHKGRLGDFIFLFLCPCAGASSTQLRIEHKGKYFRAQDQILEHKAKFSEVKTKMLVCKIKY